MAGHDDESAAPTRPSDDAALDNPAWFSLSGPHAGFAQRVGRAVRFHPGVAPIAALPTAPTGSDWSDAAELVGPGGALLLFAVPDAPPPDWTTTMRLSGVQIVGDAVAGRPDPEAVLLTTDDVPEMTDLARRARPGPFRPRTIELGTYLGIRHDDRLVAMAGERLRLPGHTEISAVCTDPDHRGRGLATRLVLALVQQIRDRGETPILHADGRNTTAIRLYERLGFVVRMEVVFQRAVAP
ncbi:GNAT family N-acetyltransferase [Gordonia paraffinivorans]|uniref:GNAT family N-acetyltransferase n=1 Tax=Gordonia paraffinivorans TaxID=175628 RepID=UPI001445D62C|nr:GNAT family N-acetyltransferase [Gordonia paraffinivorans]